MPQTSSRKQRKQPCRDSPFTVADKLIAGIREFARVFGVDFFSVISRGSQFKVESFMFRIAKPESFVLRSPSKHEVTRPIFEITSLTERQVS
jgi:DNA polymerase zeta